MAELCEALSVAPEELARVCDGLRQRGRLVEGPSGRRVRIPASDRPLSADRLRPRPESTVGAKTVLFDEVDSTNEEAWRRHERDESPHGLTLVAERQTAGRGRGENTWHSPPGTGLWFSVLLHLDWPGDRVSLLTQMVGVQLSRALEPFLDASPLVKWPNDLHLAGRKVAGILTEARSQEGAPTVAVVGIGVNVNQSPGDFPDELTTLATSLRVRTEWPLDRARILDALLDGLETGVGLLGEGSLETLDEALRARSAVLGRRVRVRGAEGEVSGEVTAQSLAGGLVLRTDGGETRRFRGEAVHSLDLLE
ncbi:MAG: biotin--[acetyl-CoA-carboxylase] ligase [Planctomycetota bacterium]